MTTEVALRQSMLISILESAKDAHPREIILLLRGKRRKDRFEITDLIIPPLATRGMGFSSFPLHMLPMDFSLIGSVHSHPSGVLKPSTVDLNRSFGNIIMIVGYPFSGVESVAVFNRSGEKISLLVIDDRSEKSYASSDR